MTSSVEADTERYYREMDARIQARESCQERIDYLLDDLTEISDEMVKTPSRVLTLISTVQNGTICECRDILEEIAEDIAMREYDRETA